MAMAFNGWRCSGCGADVHVPKAAAYYVRIAGGVGGCGEFSDEHHFCRVCEDDLRVGNQRGEFLDTLDDLLEFVAEHDLI